MTKPEYGFTINLNTGITTMNKPVGGRGKKAPYETIQMRVPLPLKTRFEAEIAKFRNTVLTGDKPVDRFANISDLVREILQDEGVTRKGKDTGACKRALSELVRRLEQGENP